MALGIAGVLLVVGAAILALTPVNANGISTRGSVNCGTALAPKRSFTPPTPLSPVVEGPLNIDSNAVYSSIFVAGCEKPISHRRQVAGAMLVLGIIAGRGAFLLRTRRAVQADPV